MRLFDYCAAIGHFPFRDVPEADPQRLMELMDAEGIDAALVSALEAVAYRNAQTANERLAECIGPWPGRLIGAAVINPRYAGAVTDAERCIRDLNMRAIRLLPTWHGYQPSEGDVAPVLDAAADLGVPVSIVARIEDERQRHPLIRTPALDITALAAAIRAHPRTAFVVERAKAGEIAALADAAADAPNWSFEISGKTMFPSPLPMCIAALLERLGARRVLFGSDMPLQYPRAAIWKLWDLNLAPSDLERVASSNAANLLDLNPQPA